MPPRIVGLYALAQMERDGEVHGYLLSKRIADRTQGAWCPSAGTIYPSLKGLVERGLARRLGSGRRREYRITPKGRALLRKVRRRVGSGASRAPDLLPLWAEVAGTGDVEGLLLRRLHRSLDAISATLASPSASPGLMARRARLRTRTVAELSSRLVELRRRGPAVRSGAPPRRRRGRA